jgi:hypothetical protein
MADLTITASQVQPGTGRDVTTAQGTAGATITAGQAVYMDETDSNKIKLADADTLAASKVLGIALHAALSGQPVVYQKTGIITLGTGAAPTKGTSYWVSSTAGGVGIFGDLGASAYRTLLGIADSTSTLKLGILQSGVTA